MPLSNDIGWINDSTIEVINTTMEKTAEAYNSSITVFGTQIEGFVTTAVIITISVMMIGITVSVIGRNRF